LSRQRWGTFSVRDHVDPHPFAADVLLYDRLILPVPGDSQERTRWADAGWQPDRLDKLLEVLRTSGDEQKRHAITVTWNQNTRDLFNQRVLTASVVSGEANKLHWTRQLLAGELRPEAPVGVIPVSVVATYPSVDAAEQDWVENPADQPRAVLTAALAHSFLVPAPRGRGDLELLRDAVALADEEDFQQKRARMHAWQDDVLQKGISTPKAVEEMAQYVEEYNAATKKAMGEVYRKFAFTLIPIAIAAVPGPLSIPAGLAGIAELVKFWIFDRKPVIQAGDAEAGAMLHTVRTELGWKPLAA
jgi:hypothetical protein